MQVVEAASSLATLLVGHIIRGMLYLIKFSYIPGLCRKAGSGAMVRLGESLGGPPGRSEPKGLGRLQVCPDRPSNHPWSELDLRDDAFG